MNDRFDALLRDHLLGTADTTVADGQLARALQAVGGTAQRNAVAARWATFPARLHGLPLPALRHGLVAAALIASMIGAALYGSSSAGRSTPFEGTWRATDPVDGSARTLTVGAGRTPDVHFVDDFESAGACTRTPSKVFTADGTANVRDVSQLFVDWPTGGGCGPADLNVALATWIFNYDAATDVIVDRDEVTWRRTQAAEAPPTRGPSRTADVPTLAVDDDCFDLTNGGVYTAPVGSLVLSMTVPSGPATRWQGYRERQFNLSGSCLFEMPVAIQASIVSEVYSDACDPAASAVRVATPADAIETLGAQRGHAVRRLDSPASLGGFPVAAFAVRIGTAECRTIELWNGAGLGDGDGIAYLVDVDGVTLGILLRFRHTDWREQPTQEQRAEAESVVESLRIERP